MFSSEKFGKREAITYWPPAYSSVLSLTLHNNFASSLKGVRLIHAIIWILINIGWFILSIRILNSRVLVIFAFVLLYLSGLWIYVTHVASELLFFATLIFTILCFSQGIQSYQADRRVLWIGLGSSILLFSFLTRYAGISILMAIIILVAIRSFGKTEKENMFLHSFWPILICSIGIISWLVRNKLSGGSFNKQIDSAMVLDTGAVPLFYEKLMNSTFGIPSTFLAIGLTALVSILVLSLVVFKKDLVFLNRWPADVLCTALILVTYLGMLFSLGLTSKQYPTARFFQMLNPLATMLVCYSWKELEHRKDASVFAKNVLRGSFAVLFVLILIAGFHRGLEQISEIRGRMVSKDGYSFLPFSGSSWVYDWTKQAHSDVVIYSNFYDFLELITDRQVLRIPQNLIFDTKHNYPEKKKYFVLFRNNLWRNYLPTEDQIRQTIPHDVIREDQQVAILQIR